MGFIDKVLKGFLGDKSVTYLKEVKKAVTKIKAVEPAIKAVSYTHLDVYKRQGLSCIACSTSKFLSPIPKCAVESSGRMMVSLAYGLSKKHFLQNPIL